MQKVLENQAFLHHFNPYFVYGVGVKNTGLLLKIIGEYVIIYILMTEVKTR